MIVRELIIGGSVIFLASSCFGQLASSEVHFYTYANLSHTIIVLGSAENRTGSGISLAAGKTDPKLMLNKRIPGELIWEFSYNESHTDKPSVRYPSRTNQALAVFATARYRWPTKSSVTLYGDGGLGFAVLRHSSKDLPLANNFMIGGGFGAEFSTGAKSSLLLGTRYIHTSNAGRKKPNYGENLLQYYVGYSWTR